MKKRIVFHLYYNKSLMGNVMYRVHKTCLSRYSHLFNTAIFNIVLDDVTDEVSLNEAKQFIFDTGFKEENTTFYVSENGKMRDSQTFYDYIVKSLGSYDGITFFGHSKGLTNIRGIENKDENIIYWVTAMYFFNLENIDEFENGPYIAYMNPLVDNSNYIAKHPGKCTNEPMYGYYPIGTFFCIKDRQLLEYIQNNNITLPVFENRFYDENFIGNILPFEFPLLGSYCNHYGYDMVDFYNRARFYIVRLYGETEGWDSYEDLCKNFLIDRKKTVQVIYMATDNYKKYSEKFISTLHYLMPGHRKHVVIITDDILMIGKMARTYANEDLTFEIHKMPGNCPYPCVNLSKFAYVNSFMSDEYDYIFYFDSDTYFVERPENVWTELEHEMDMNKICLAYHPAVMNSIANPNDKDSIRLSIDLCDERPESKLYDKLGIKQEDYVWAITSYFSGTNVAMNNFTSIANKKVKEAMKGPKLCWMTEYYVPRLFDETIANKMIYDWETGELLIVDFSVEYRVISVDGYYNIFPNVICIQKYPTNENNKNHD